MIIHYQKYPYCTLAGLRAVRGQIDMLRDMKQNSLADNMEHMADDLEELLVKIAAAHFRPGDMP